ncbi:MAG: preprotein translocase subunit SecE [Candidatus Pacebacteria bacterium]|jgi:preprotein translocase SecE subunit|nr:preprotein translocase subunit SecE [Candidatus Paceibacterota bacterium]
MKLISFLKEVAAEWNHIKWPTQREVLLYVVMVIIVSGAVAYYLGFLDIAFSKLLGVIVL